MPPSDPSETSVKPADPPAASQSAPAIDLRAQMLTTISQVVLEEAQRVLRGQRESAFCDGQMPGSAVALLRMAPALAPKLQHVEQQLQQQVVNCPACFICGAPPGEHWTHECDKIHPESRANMIFDYATRGIFYRDSLGQPAPQLTMPIQDALEQWLTHNELSLMQYDAHITASELKKKVEEVIEHANTARFLAERSGNRDAQVAANIATDIVHKVVDVLKSRRQLDIAILRGEDPPASDQFNWIDDESENCDQSATEPANWGIGSK